MLEIRKENRNSQQESEMEATDSGLEKSRSSQGISLPQPGYRALKTVLLDRDGARRAAWARGCDWAGVGLLRLQMGTKKKLSPAGAEVAVQPEAQPR